MVVREKGKLKIGADISLPRQRLGPSRTLAAGDALASFLRDEAGADGLEYGLIAALISVVIIATIRAVGTHLTKTSTTSARRFPPQINCANR